MKGIALSVEEMEIFPRLRWCLQFFFLVFPAESFSLEPFRNAVRVFRDWKVIYVDAENGLTLCDAYNNEDALFDLIAKISQFKL